MRGMQPAAPDTLVQCWAARAHNTFRMQQLQTTTCLQAAEHVAAAGAMVMVHRLDKVIQHCSDCNDAHVRHVKATSF
jgi:hypothetical protein